MAFILSDRVKETTSTTGTGTYTLGGASTGFESFASIGNSNTTYYCCTDGTDFEVGIGTYTASGTTLARTTILQSSNSDNAVNWSAGTREIFCTLPAEKSVVKDASGDVTLAGKLTTGTIDSGDIRIEETSPTLLYNDTNESTDNKAFQLTGNGGVLTIQYLNDSLGGGGGYIQFPRTGNNLDSLDMYRAGVLKNRLTTTGDNYITSGNLGIGTTSQSTKPFSQQLPC